MHPPRRYVSIAPAALVLLLGAVTTAGVGVALASRERRSASQAMDRQVDLAQAAVGGEVQRYVDTLAAALGSHDALTPDAFGRTPAADPDDAWRPLQRPPAPAPAVLPSPGRAGASVLSDSVANHNAK